MDQKNKSNLAGRPKGVPNKISGTAKENIQAVFVRLGSTAQMAEWAKDNQTEFYKIYARMLPIEGPGVDGAHKIMHDIKMVIVDAS